MGCIFPGKNLSIEKEKLPFDKFQHWKESYKKNNFFWESQKRLREVEDEIARLRKELKIQISEHDNAKTQASMNMAVLDGRTQEPQNANGLIQSLHGQVLDVIDKEREQ